MDARPDAAPACPHCGSHDSRRYLYGRIDPDTYRGLPQDVVLRGCCIEPDSADRGCGRCGKDFRTSTPDPRVEIDVADDLEAI